MGADAFGSYAAYKLVQSLAVDENQLRIGSGEAR
jgi:hypothetical protein